MRFQHFIPRRFALAAQSKGELLELLEEAAQA